MGDEDTIENNPGGSTQTTMSAKRGEESIRMLESALKQMQRTGAVDHSFGWLNNDTENCGEEAEKVRLEIFGLCVGR